MNTTPSTKLRVLSLLRESQGWLSGEYISEKLGVSRSAVAKHASALRAEGYLIEAVSRRGYLLKMEPDIVDLKLLKNAIKTKFVGAGSGLGGKKRAPQIARPPLSAWRALLTEASSWLIFKLRAGAARGANGFQPPAAYIFPFCSDQICPRGNFPFYHYWPASRSKKSLRN